MLRRDDKRPDSVTMKFEGDKRLYWFPVIEVRGWLEDMRHRRVVMPSAMEAKKDKGTAREESCPAPEDGLGTEEAASVLAELSAAGDSAAAGL